MKCERYNIECPYLINGIPQCECHPDEPCTEQEFREWTEDYLYSSTDE